jgi:hypothetical protein
MRDGDLVAGDDQGRERVRCDPKVGRLCRGRHRFSPPQKGIAAKRHDDTHRSS